MCPAVRQVQTALSVWVWCLRQGVCAASPLPANPLQSHSTTFLLGPLVFLQVFRATWRETEVAIKVLHTSGLTLTLDKLRQVQGVVGGCEDGWETWFVWYAAVELAQSAYQQSWEVHPNSLQHGEDVLIQRLHTSRAEQCEAACVPLHTSSANLLQEAGMLASLRHPNCVSIIGVTLEPPCIVSEYCARGGVALHSLYCALWQPAC